MNYPTTLVENPSILYPDTGLGKHADKALNALHSQGFVAAVGLTAEHAETIVEACTDETIMEYCPNDGPRFSRPEVWTAKDGGRGFVGIYDVEGNDGIPLSPRDMQDVRPEDLFLGAYGWSGFLKNKHVPGVDITTAFRVSKEGQRLAVYRRERAGVMFSLGHPLGELVIATGVVLYGVDPKQLGLEVWGSNRNAIKLYDKLGFSCEATESDVRPTQKPVGAVIDEEVVYLGDDGRAMVRDTRQFHKLVAHPILHRAMPQPASDLL